MRNSLGNFQSVLVLGGGSEIALATVEQLIDSGAETVVLAGRNTATLEDLAKPLSKKAAKVTAEHFDASDTASHRALISGLFERYGDFDLVIVAFGVLGPGNKETADDSVGQLLEVAQTNYVGAVSVMLLSARLMRKQGHGTIVLLSSVSAVRVRKSNYVYGSSKAGIDGFAQGLGDSLYGSGVEVAIVRPGFVKTKMTEGLQPAPFSTTPEQVGKEVVAGLRRQQKIIWSPPILRVVMLIIRLLPRTIFRRLDM